MSKPKSCFDCPVFKQKGKEYICSVYKRVKTLKEVEEMYKKCPIGWTKK